MTNREYLNTIDVCDATIIIILKNTEIESKIKQSIIGSNVRNKLCEKYGVDPHDGDQYSKLQKAMLKVWLAEECTNVIK